jgi:HK97 family phage prohead protease
VQREYKSFPLEIKDIDSKQGIFTGYCSSYGVKDAGGDIVDLGAFSKTIKERGPQSNRPRVKCLYQHDPFHPIGKPLVLEEKSFGLYHETKLSGTTMGKDALILLEEKVITEQSIGYSTIKAENKDGSRHLKELVLWEYSPVTWGMNEVTPITGVKSLEDPEKLAKQMSKVQRILKKGELSSDEMIEALETTLGQWQEALKHLQSNDDSKREVINIDKKDFNERLASRLIWRDFWLYTEIIQTEILRTMRDSSISDKPMAISADIDQFKNVLLDWVARAQQSGVFSDNGMKQLMDTEAEVKEKLNNLVIETATSFDEAVVLAIKAVDTDTSNPDPPQEDETVSAIKALVADLKPGDHSESEGAADEPETNPEIIQFVKELMDDMKTKGVNE